MKARERRAAEFNRLVTGTTKPAMPVLLATLAETDPWLSLDVSPVDGSALPGRAAAMLGEAARVCRGHAHASAVGDGPGLHQRLQQVASSCVATVAAAPKLPQRVWAAPDPVTETIRDGKEEVWATLVRMQDRFALVHQLAGVIREMGGLGASALLQTAPNWGYAYRQWGKVNEQELKRLHPALRLRYAVDNGWEPGLWPADDLVRPEPEQARRGLVGLLIPSPLRGG